MNHNSDRLLAAVGFTELQERAYLHLLDDPGLTSEDLAELLGRSPSLASACLDELEAKGFVAAASTGQGYLPAPPEIAIRALVALKHDDLGNTERLIGRLLKRRREAMARRGRRRAILETITGEDALSARLDQLQRTATDEILGFVTGGCPYGPAQRSFEGARERGVRIRMTYDRAAVMAPGLLEAAQRQVSVGGEVRIASSLPCTLLVFDRKLALVPERDDVVVAVLVWESTVLETLLMFVETVWDRAARLDAPPEWEDDQAGEYNDLITLLAAGLKDGAIARRLRLSTRTLDRRVRSLMDSLDAATRFQAGWLAAQRRQATADRQP